MALFCVFSLGRAARNSILLARIRAEADRVVTSKEHGWEPSSPVELGRVERAAATLGDARSKRAIPALVTLLQHRDPSIKSHAAGALGRIRSKKAVEPLLQFLEETSPATYHARRMASLALWRIIGETYGMDALAWREALGLPKGGEASP